MWICFRTDLNGHLLQVNQEQVRRTRMTMMLLNYIPYIFKQKSLRTFIYRLRYKHIFICHLCVLGESPSHVTNAHLRTDKFRQCAPLRIFKLWLFT